MKRNAVWGFLDRITLKNFLEHSINYKAAFTSTSCPVSQRNYAFSGKCKNPSWLASLLYF